jgi:two-component system CheB/CheR fusion protein
VLTTELGDILYVGGRTGKYLEPAAGRANLNVFAMAREGLRRELSAAFASALHEERPVIVRGVRIGTEGASQVLDLTVQRLPDPKELRGTVMIVFHDVVDAPATPRSTRTRQTGKGHPAQELERELVRTREDLQTTREEMQTSQEELRSTNEELQSTNEELQSSNEELTTSKEEMESMNEELTTVNHELQSKVDDLSRAGSDMKNLLNSTDIATLFLDGALLVRRFTTQTSRLIKLIPSDTGRPITDIATELAYPELAEHAREVLHTLLFKEKEVAARDGRWFNVRILPYRTLDNVIDGVVITFSDVTATKRLEQSLQAQTGELRRMSDSLPCLVWGCRADGACEYLNRRWLEYTGVPEAEQLGYGWLEQIHPDEQARARRDWMEAVRTGSALELEHRLRGSDGSFRWFLSRIVPINDERGVVARWYGTSFDVDRLKRGTGSSPVPEPAVG